MSHDADATARTLSRLASVFDAFPTGTPMSLAALELAMSLDTERRALAALDRALARLAGSAPTIPPPPATPGLPARPPPRE